MVVADVCGDQQLVGRGVVVVVVCLSVGCVSFEDGMCIHVAVAVWRSLVRVVVWVES